MEPRGTSAGVHQSLVHGRGKNQNARQVDRVEGRDAMTPKPESETDPWADVEAAYADIAVNKTARVYLADVVESARAAEAAQHQQEMSQQAAHIANLEHMVREHGQFGDLFQPGGRFHKDAQLEPGSVAVVAGGKWLVARLVAVEAERANQYTQAVEATQRSVPVDAGRVCLKAGFAKA